MTTWNELRKPRRVKKSWPEIGRKLAEALGCLAIGAVLGYLYGRAF
jgi:hypothetical protein